MKKLLFLLLTLTIVFIVPAFANKGNEGLLPEAKKGKAWLQGHEVLIEKIEIYRNMTYGEEKNLHISYMDTDGGGELVFREGALMSLTGRKFNLVATPLWRAGADYKVVLEFEDGAVERLFQILLEGFSGRELAE